MKKLTRLFVLATIATSLVFTACKKENPDDAKLNAGTDQKLMASDEETESSETETSLNEINTALASTGFGKNGPISGATIDDSTFISQKKIVITYNGTTSDGFRMRTGVVEVQLIAGNMWRDAGAILKIDYNNFKIVRLATGTAIKITGTFNVENVTGGRAFIDATVVHKLWGSAVTTFDNTLGRRWYINRRRTFENTSGLLKVTTEGDTTVNNTSNIVVMGENRQGNSFYTQINEPVVYTSECIGKPISGVKTHKGLVREIQVTFGVDETGNPYTGSGCPYGLKISWLNNQNEQKTAIISY